MSSSRLPAVALLALCCLLPQSTAAAEEAGCIAYGCSDSGKCNAYGCPPLRRHRRHRAGVRPSFGAVEADRGAALVWACAP